MNSKANADPFGILSIFLGVAAEVIRLRLFSYFNSAPRTISSCLLHNSIDSSVGKASLTINLVGKSNALLLSADTPKILAALESPSVAGPLCFASHFEQILYHLIQIKI